MKSKKEYIKSLKKGVQETVKAIQHESSLGFSAKDDKKVIEAQKQGILAAQKMIMKVYKYSEAEGIPNSLWVTSWIKKLLKASDPAMKRLTEAVIVPWNEDADEDDIKTFYQNKMKATEDYNEIAESVGELEQLIENVDEHGNIVIRDRGDFRASWPELNKDRPSKAGYRKDIDAIVICPDGTVGEIREVYGLRIALPEQPTEDKFINCDVEDAEDQYWVRSDMPHGLTKETEDSFKAYIQDQYDKKHLGAWFYNNGEPTYLTGAHWFLLQWGKTDADGDDIHEKGYFHYREAHRDLFYWMEAVWVDERCLGMVYIKTRRTGATWCFTSFANCKSITTSSANFGLTSKTDIDGQKIFNTMLVGLFAKLPFFFKPIRLSDTPKKVMEFKEPQRRITKTNLKENKEYEALDTELSYRSTTDDAYDQYALKMYIGDEFSKWKKPQNILNHWRMLSRALTAGSRIRGKAYLLSTVENVKGYDDPEDKEAGMGDKYKYLCDNSIPSERNENGRTRTGLYELFIPCDDNFEGFIDMYGKAVKRTPEKPIKGVDGQLITQGINEFLEEEAKSQKTPDDLYNFWRLNPRFRHEAFRVATEDSIFDLHKVTKQTEYNDNNPENYVQGNFEWKDGLIPANPEDAQVTFVPRVDGKFRVSWIPDEQYQNAKIRKGQKVMPANGFAGSLGADPYRASETVNRKGSNGAIHGCTRASNPIGPSNKIFLEYCTRPATVKEYTWDVIKACVFYGMPILMENSVTDSLRYMEEWGYRWYSSDRPDKKPNELTVHERELGGYPATPDIIDRLTNAVAWYIDSFVGDPDDMKRMPFNDTLNDWSRFQKKNRTKHDMTVSSSLAIFASRSQQFKKMKQGGKVVPKGLVRTFKINGHTSTRL